jgi:ABC-type Na+ transport system ATPase subunit NatA
MLHLVQEICSRVVIIDRGKKVADGTIDQLAAQAQMAGAGSSLEQIFLQVTSRDDTAEPAATLEP